jgi:hypothetical protein
MSNSPYMMDTKQFTVYEIGKYHQTQKEHVQQILPYFALSREVMEYRPHA